MAVCSVIIVSYNTFELTKAAVESCLTAGGDTVKVDVVVVDNNSPDDSGILLTEYFEPSQYPNVRVIARDDNIGFSGANNVGLRSSTGEVLFFLNPDTIVHDNAIEKLYRYVVSNPKVGVVGPLVLNVDGTVQPSTGRFVSFASIVNQNLPVLRFLKPRELNLTEPSKVEIVKGCSIAVLRKNIESVGGWDESIFMYSEESELCQALVDLGFQNYFFPGAVITHYGGSSTSQDYLKFAIVHQRSFARHLSKHGSLWLQILNRISGAVGFGIRSVAFSISQLVLSGDAKANHIKRGATARRLFRWFTFEYDFPEAQAKSGHSD